MASYYTRKHKIRARNKRDEVEEYLMVNPEASVSEIMKKLGVSSSYAHKVKAAYNQGAKKAFDVALGEPMKKLKKLTAIKKDMVNQPAHYSGDVECIDAMVSAFGAKRVRQYSEIAAFKYLWRQGKKGNAAQDKAKAIWYTRYSLGDDPRSDK